MRAAPLDIWKLWIEQGVYARVHECVPQWNNKGKLLPSRCVRAELTGISRAASLLRVDLPVRTFHYNYLNHTFSSGWLLHPDTVIWNAAFAHDAHSGSNYKTRRPCAGTLTAVKYAEERLRVSINCTNENAFLKSRLNCYVRNMTLMREMQRAYVARAPSTCSGNINQVQLTYSEKDIVGVFYANRRSKAYAIRASNHLGGVPVVDITALRPLKSDRPCLRNLTEHDTSNYFARLGWQHHVSLVDLDVLWMDLLPDPVQSCLSNWIGHDNVGYYAHPIGGKVRYSIIWNYRPELKCEGVRSSHGGSRAHPYMLHNRTYEVARYDLKSEQTFEWYYHARGGGCWYTGMRVLVFHDHADLFAYTQKSNLKDALTEVLKLADTVAFTHHVDFGYRNQKICAKAQPGWSVVYYYQHEIVSLKRPAKLQCSGDRRWVRAVGDGKNVHRIVELNG